MRVLLWMRLVFVLGLNVAPRRKYRKRWHGGKIIFDCQHFHPYRSHWQVGERRWCNRCGELHAVMFVIKPRPVPTPQPRDPNQLSLDDIPPF